MTLADETTSASLAELATELTVAWLGNSNTRASSDEVCAFLKAMHDALRLVDGPAEPASGEQRSVNYTPATTARRSLASAEHIISMIDGKPYKTLRRHLSGHGLTPEQYRERYKLKPDYPMVAQSYSEVRRAMAKKIGLGQKGRKSGETGNADFMPSRRGRKSRTPKAQ